jgi:cytochrome oxidase Cu insertion factor (SCO1/SenC/PrrC family)/thiol-disulfide isomerase/thioredoxin
VTSGVTRHRCWLGAVLFRATRVRHTLPDGQQTEEDREPATARPAHADAANVVTDLRRLARLGRWARSTAPALVAVATIAVVVAPVARADGDPGSDVLVYQDLFAGTDAGLSVQQQAELGSLLKSAAAAGFPIRVAIIASPFDLGAVTELWREPRTYARFLGYELSLAYKQRLLVVMPNGFGFNWPGHSATSANRVLAGVPIRSGAGGLFGATETAVAKLARAGGVKLPSCATVPASSATPAGAGAGATEPPAPRRATDEVLGIVVLVLVAIAGIAFTVLRMSRRRGWTAPRLSVPRLKLPSISRLAIPGGAALVIVLVAGLALLVRLSAPAQSQTAALAANPYLDPGTPIHGVASDFTLSDQFGQSVSLHSFRGKVVILAFNDSECTTVCPLTTTAMVDAKAMLGKAGSQVQLLGVDANPAATSLEDVWSYSELHGMLDSWRFLTGTLRQLTRVWKDYGIEAAIEAGEITHTPALFVIDREGRLSRLYVTQMSYTAVPQLGQLLAQSAAALLPGSPKVHTNLSYASVQPTAPTQRASVPRVGGGTVKVGPGQSGRLFVFFATWDQETSGLAGELDALNGYQAIAARTGLPELTAVDEASVEPSLETPTKFLAHLPHPLSYPVALDESGKLADGYEVLGLPWFVLTSPSGQLLYYREVSTAGWPSTSVLVRYVKAALARVSKLASPAASGQELAGSPPLLASLHHQADRLLGNQSALASRLRALRGYPIVINAWASWCAPCRTEFSLFASASARYGRQVAFLGADTDDSAGDARTFLAQHPVSYPSYETTTPDLSSLAAIAGLPTTIFINRAGKVVFVHTGQYDSQGTLDSDISTYAPLG